MKFYGEMEQSSQDRDGRMELLTDRLYRLQSSLEEDSSKRELKCTAEPQLEKALQSRLGKLQKSCKRTLEGVIKVRRG